MVRAFSPLAGIPWKEFAWLLQGDGTTGEQPNGCGLKRHQKEERDRRRGSVTKIGECTRKYLAVGSILLASTPQFVPRRMEEGFHFFLHMKFFLTLHLSFRLSSISASPLTFDLLRVSCVQSCRSETRPQLRHAAFLSCSTLHTRYFALHPVASFLRTIFIFFFFQFSLGALFADAKDGFGSTNLSLRNLKKLLITKCKQTKQERRGFSFFIQHFCPIAWVQLPFIGGREIF